jgi:hypothetical protein
MTVGVPIDRNENIKEKRKEIKLKVNNDVLQVALRSRKALMAAADSSSYFHWRLLPGG